MPVGTRDGVRRPDIGSEAADLQLEEMIQVRNEHSWPLPDRRLADQGEYPRTS